MISRKYIRSLYLLSLVILTMACSQPKVKIVVNAPSDPRISFAVERLTKALEESGYRISEDTDDRVITLDLEYSTDSQEAFQINSDVKSTSLTGSDASGLLYASLELAQKIKEAGMLSFDYQERQQPDMVLRGTCIGLQKTEYLPGRTVYEYPYTPENFPWFYDKELWIDYLDMMVENRFNALYLWNGHPFASLVKLDDYPYALEVDEATFKQNEEMFTFLTTEAEKRGIWVIQMFYNIIVSKPFAEHHGIKTQERSRPITPLIKDYTEKSITAYVEKYPNVGLLVTLGEAMHTIDDDVEWFTETIIPGVQKGLETIGETEEPPIVLRGHDTDASRVMEAALPTYKNLYTMFKYNGESLTTYEPRDAWESIPKELSELGSVHISNVHILANLEPFRYSSPDFIQKSIKAMKNIQGANGLHLYPQTAYWDWPYTADKVDGRLLQIDRDWMWYQCWSRYAWNADRSRDEEMLYWTHELGEYYECEDYGAHILEAYEQMGEIAPKLLRTFGISDGNRQTLLLGMFMGQLVNPFKYHVYENFLTSNGPVGEILIDYAAKEWNNEPHIGETPPQIIKEVVAHADYAVKAIERAAPKIKENKEEFNRLKNDVYCYRAIANYFAEKVKAAMLVLRYKYSEDIDDLEQAIPHLERSIVYYVDLVERTKDMYLYANSMQTAMRRIPIMGRDGKNKTWEELLPHYQTELEVFKRNIDMLKTKGKSVLTNEFNRLEPVKVDILNEGAKIYPLRKGTRVYTDNEAIIEQVAEELQNLSGVRFSDKKQQEKGTVLKFKSDQPVKVLVGYFNTNSYTTLRPPTLEFNAHANDRGQADIKIANAFDIPGLYPVNVYTYSYESGEHELILAKGRVLILGFINGNEQIPIHDAGITDSEDGPSVDWLFY